MNIQELEQTYELAVYPRRDIVLVRGRGARLFDENGREYIDCAANVGVSNIGHGNEAVARAVHDQYLTLANCYSMFYNPVRARLAEKLASLAPGNLNRVFFCNSGAEANEAAIKFARTSTGRQEVIAAMRGFHGKTMGALAATWGPEYQKPFAPMLPGFKHVPYNNVAKLESTVDHNTAAVLLEVIQGEGGVRIGDKAYFQETRQICDANGILLIIDEVQTGFGRTGSMFACEQFVVPDMLCLAKSLAGGIPMGAVICSDRIKVPVKSHTSTFGGNPTACAAALATLDVIEKEGLVGLMLGIELKEKAGPYVQNLMEKGVLALLAGATVIRLLPPLVITKEEIDTVVQALKDTLSA